MSDRVTRERVLEAIAYFRHCGFSGIGRSSLEAIEAFINQEPEANPDDAVREEIPDLLLALDKKTGGTHWVYGQGPHHNVWGIIANNDADGEFHRVERTDYTAVQLRDKLREMDTPEPEETIENVQVERAKLQTALADATEKLKTDAIFHATAVEGMGEVIVERDATIEELQATVEGARAGKGGCKILSKGDACDCELCKRDAMIAELQATINGPEAVEWNCLDDEGAVDKIYNVRPHGSGFRIFWRRAGDTGQRNTTVQNDINELFPVRKAAADALEAYAKARDWKPVVTPEEETPDDIRAEYSKLLHTELTARKDAKEKLTAAEEVSRGLAATVDALRGVKWIRPCTQTIAERTYKVAKVDGLFRIMFQMCGSHNWLPAGTIKLAATCLTAEPAASVLREYAKEHGWTEVV